MDVGSVNSATQTSWKQVAVQKQERLRTGAEGETIKEMIEVIIPTVYTKTGNRVEATPLAPTQKVDIKV